ncbi:MAG: DUF1127 domain-containing protein [Pseudomonadota bacterium]
MQTQTTHGLPHSPAFDPRKQQSVPQRIKRALGAWWFHFAKRRRVNRQFKRFLEMSDYMLQDIGLTREQILADRHRYHLQGELPDYNR